MSSIIEGYLQSYLADISGLITLWRLRANALGLLDGHLKVPGLAI